MLAMALVVLTAAALLQARDAVQSGEPNAALATWSVGLGWA